jgi:hypothetical protein
MYDLKVFVFSLIGEAYRFINTLEKTDDLRVEMLPSSGTTQVLIHGRPEAVEKITFPAACAIKNVNNQVLEAWYGLAQYENKNQDKLRVITFETESLANAFIVADLLSHSGAHIFEFRCLRGAVAKCYLSATSDKSHYELINTKFLLGHVTEISQLSPTLSDFLKV